VSNSQVCGNKIDYGRVRLKPDGTRWRMGGEVKEKLTNGVGSQYSHTTSERCVSSITTANAHTSAASSRMNWLPPPPADLNGLVRFGERRNMVSACVPSRFKRTITYLRVVPYFWNVIIDNGQRSFLSPAVTLHSACPYLKSICICSPCIFISCLMLT
jgi:hypothetical protein